MGEGEMFNQTVKFLMDCKIWLARAGSYVAVLNMGMLMLLVLDKLKAYGFTINLQSWGVALFFSTLILLIFVGYLDWKFGLLRYETSRTQQQNPEIQQIRRDVEEIKGILYKLDVK
jgi:hypothetical protein